MWFLQRFKRYAASRAQSTAKPVSMSEAVKPVSMSEAVKPVSMSEVVAMRQPNQTRTTVKPSTLGEVAFTRQLNQMRLAAKPTTLGEASFTRQLRAMPKDEREMVAMYPGDQVMWRHPQGYCFVVQVVAVRSDEVIIKLMRNGEVSQLRVSPNTLSVTLAQARASAQRRATQQPRRLALPQPQLQPQSQPEAEPQSQSQPHPTMQLSAVSAGRTVRWHREGAEPVMAHVLEVHWSDTAAKICPVGQRLTCWVDMPMLEVVA